MSATSRPLSRRAFLRGVAGSVLALPALEVMLDSTGHAFAATGDEIPNRFLVCLAATSLGADLRDVSYPHLLYFPDKEGPDYDVKPALESLNDYGDIRKRVSVVSEMMIPWGETEAPEGGWVGYFHNATYSAILSGMRNSGGASFSHGPTSDQVAAKWLAGDTMMPSFAYRGQASHYLAPVKPHADLMSYRETPDGRIEGIAPVTSPRLAYNALITGIAPADSAARAKREAELLHRRSILDYVATAAKRLTGRLGYADRIRMDRHFTEVRELERRLLAIERTAPPTCDPMADPGPDPPISGNNTSEGGEDFDVTLGYSNETERIRAFCDLIHLAFTCDLSRAGSLMMTIAQSHLNMYPIIGEPWDLHEISHGSREPEVVGKAIAWHVDFFAYLAAKLRDTPEGDGSVLDHCAMVLVHEGGWGRNGSAPAALDVFPDITSHSTENMGCLIAGGAGGLKGGVHVRAHRQHPVRVLNTALRAVGVNEELGEVKGTIDGLLG